jgi:RNA polymerase sigma-70 factor (ECF subfamily)
MPPFENDPSGNLSFEDTQWSLVRNAAQGTDTAAEQALEHVCRSYWYPLYAYVRRQGYAPQEAEDLTQAFFARLLEKNYLGQANQERGRFRSFLLACLRHFLSDERDRLHTQKRGGNLVAISLDAEAGEVRYQTEFVERSTPEELFDHRWAVTALERAQTRLHQEYLAAGKDELFQGLRLNALEIGAETSYAELGSRLHLTEEAVKSAVYRLRRRYRELVREEVSCTVSDPADIDDEVQYLIGLISKG